MRAAAVTLAAALLACGSPSSPAPEAPRRSVEARYVATVLPAEAADDEVTGDALDGATEVIERELGRSGGVVDEEVDGLPRYVFRPNVGEVRAEPSGRTRATVTILVEQNGRIVASLRGTATAYVERDAALGDRQLAAIEGAIQGAFANLPELVARLESR